MSIFSNDDQGPVPTISNGTTTLSETRTRLLFFRDSHVDVDVDGTQTSASWNRRAIKSSKKKKITHFAKAQWEVTRSFIAWVIVFRLIRDYRSTISASFLHQQETPVICDKRLYFISPAFLIDRFSYRKTRVTRRRGVIRCFYHWIHSLWYSRICEKLLIWNYDNVLYNKNVALLYQNLIQIKFFKCSFKTKR